MSGSAVAGRFRRGADISLDGFPGPSVGSRKPSGDLRIRSATDGNDAGVDFERLEKAVLRLVDRYEALQRENARLVKALEVSGRRLAELEAEVREGNQLRSDVAKRLDDLVSQIDRIEDRFAAETV